MHTRHEQSNTEAPTATLGFSPLSELRTLVSAGLAEAVATAAPHVIAAFQDEYRRCVSTAERDILRFGSSVLLGRQELLAEMATRCLHQRFDAKLNCPADTLSHTGQFSVGALKLMEELGMQEDCELEECVNQMRAECKAELATLTSHLCPLLGRNSMPESHNPASPRVLLRALMDALTKIGCDACTRRAALRIYQPLLSRVLKAIYARANMMFSRIKRGCLLEFENYFEQERLAA